MRLLATLLLALALPLGGCATWPDRIPHTALQADQASVPGFPSVRYWADAPRATFAGMRTGMASQAPAAREGALLALSGGADDGAYAAGFLSGWSETGERPEFTIVSGVSTGALIAPFAFLGSDYDNQLRDFYTGITREDIYRKRGIVGILTQPSLADTAPLVKLIAQNVDEALLEAIATEHRKGRRLRVQTTNLDTARGVIWDMGAIAQSPDPRRLALFRQVLLASASMPGLFAPVMIEVSQDNGSFSEMHVDGATTAGFLAVPESILAGRREDQQGLAHIYVLLNSRLRPRYEAVEPSVFAIIGRALDTVLSSHDRASLLNVQYFAQDNDIAFAMSSIGPEFEVQADGLFSQSYMNALFEHGLRRGREGAWTDSLLETSMAELSPTPTLPDPNQTEETP